MNDKSKFWYLVPDREKSIQKYRRKGYQFVRPRDVKDTDDTMDRMDNVVRFGDRVAMWVPHAVRDQWQKDKAYEHYKRDGKLQRIAELEAADGGDSVMYTEEDKRTRGALHSPAEFDD